MRLRRNASLAVENPGGFPTARGFAHSLHSGTYQCFQKASEQPRAFNRGVGNFQCPQLGKFECPLTTFSAEGVKHRAAFESKGARVPVQTASLVLHDPE